MMLAPLGPAVAEALRIGIGFLWTAAWAIIMGLVITSLVQVYVSKERMAAVLGDADMAGVTKATLFGAASSGCSFGAVAIGKGLFKGCPRRELPRVHVRVDEPHRRTRIDDPDPVGLGVPRCRVTRWSHPHRSDGSDRPVDASRNPFEEVRTELNQRITTTA